MRSTEEALVVTRARIVAKRRHRQARRFAVGAAAVVMVFGAILATAAHRDRTREVVAASRLDAGDNPTTSGSTQNPGTSVETIVNPGPPSSDPGVSAAAPSTAAPFTPTDPANELPSTRSVPTAPRAGAPHQYTATATTAPEPTTTPASATTSPAPSTTVMPSTTSAPVSSTTPPTTALVACLATDFRDEFRLAGTNHRPVGLLGISLEIPSIADHDCWFSDPSPMVLRVTSDSGAVVYSLQGAPSTPRLIPRGTLLVGNFYVRWDPTCAQKELGSTCTPVGVGTYTVTMDVSGQHVSTTVILTTDGS